MKKIMKSIIMFLSKLKKILKWFILNFKSANRTNKIMIEDKKILIVGNGPSAGDVNFEKFKQKRFEIACVNFFALDEQRFFTIKPKYYVLLDSAFYKNTGDKKIEKLLEVFMKVDWPMRLIRFKGGLQIIGNDNISEIYITTNELNESFHRVENKLYNMNKATFGYQNVILGALFCFCSAHVEEIALIGVENDWHKELRVDENNDVFRDMTHFYGKESINITELGEIEKHKLYKYFYFYYITLYHYYLASVYASEIGVRITNLTPASYIDTFERTTIDAYLEVN